MACLLSARRTSQIASMLSIAPRTVTTHFRNIMLRLDCNSQEGIINFIERSHKLSILREYYSTLIIELAFKKALKEISKLRKDEIPSCLIVYWRDQSLKKSLIRYLKIHLSLAGINAEVREQRLDYEIDDLKSSNQVLFLLIEEKAQTKALQEFSKFDFVDLTGQKSYYSSVLELLKKLLSFIDLDKIISGFRKYCEITSDFSEKIYIQTSSERKEPTTKSCSDFRLFSDVQKNGKQSSSVCSELIIPAASVLLNRDELLTQMAKALNKEEDIQTLALVGVGGSGKTTLARQYARNQKWSVVWEINAETQENLICSFENLAYALSQTEEEKKTLRGFQDISNSKEKEDKIVQFVKERLKIQPNWFLIYDNVERFSDIQKCFPFDTNNWGKGQIIITTRDRNIQNNNHINYTIFLEELNTDESLTLFCNIIGSEKPINFDYTQAISFLDHIPPFPLDVSIAAYYLKTTDVDYEKYLEHLSGYDKDFEVIQEDILRETTQYAKTRYNIVTLSLKRLISAHKDFEGLLLLISLLDSQDILKNLLSSYKNEIIVDNFIYHLRKYSLTICKIHNDLHSIPSLTIHRSTQEISLKYLIKKLNLNKNNHHIKSIADVLEKFVTCIFDKVDIEIMKNLKSHCESFLSHNNLLTVEIKKSVGNILGNIHFYLGNYNKAKLILEKNFISLSKKETETSILQNALSLGYLGCVYTQLGDYKRAKDFLGQSLSNFKDNFSENNVKYAWILVNLGIVERKLGRFYDAKNLFEQSLLIYKKLSPKDQKGIYWNLMNLGIIEKELSNYTKAKVFLEKSFNICIKNDPLSNRRKAGILRNLAYIYREMGNYEKAKEFIDQSLIFYKQYLPEDHIKVAKANVELGNINNMLGNNETAKSLLETSLLTCEKHFGIDHIETAQILEDLGQVYSLNGQIENAENLTMKALHIFQHNQHPKAYQSLERLAELYLKKSNLIFDKGDSQQSKTLKIQAISHLNQAFEVVKINFPKNSSHILRIKSKLKKLGQETF
ncbi:MAG: hypothetical protein BGO67_10285 [Alphaproteobacteria bacterium 41-28]|nr:MAG: hypothetical protein BGO67_10285 [Alphaproteobacteria bacterium 41-28]